MVPFPVFWRRGILLWMPTNLTIPTRRQDGTKSKNVDLFSLCVYLGCVLASVSISSCSVSRYCRLNRLTFARVHDNQLIRREDLESLLGRNGEAIRDQFLSISLPSPSLSLSPLWVSEWECVCVCSIYVRVFFLSIFLPLIRLFLFPLALRETRLTSPEQTQWSGIENTDAKASDIESTCFAIHPLLFSQLPLVDFLKDWGVSVVLVDSTVWLSFPFSFN